MQMKLLVIDFHFPAALLLNDCSFLGLCNAKWGFLCKHEQSRSFDVNYPTRTKDVEWRTLEKSLFRAKGSTKKAFNSWIFILRCNPDEALQPSLNRVFTDNTELHSDRAWKMWEALQPRQATLGCYSLEKMAILLECWVLEFLWCKIDTMAWVI